MVLLLLVPRREVKVLLAQILQRSSRKDGATLLSREVDIL